MVVGYERLVQAIGGELRSFGIRGHLVDRAGFSGKRRYGHFQVVSGFFGLWRAYRGSLNFT